MGDDTEENKFFLIEITVLKTASGNKCLDGSKRSQKRAGFKKSKALIPPNVGSTF